MGSLLSKKVSDESSALQSRRDIVKTRKELEKLFAWPESVPTHKKGAKGPLLSRPNQKSSQVRHRDTIAENEEQVLSPSNESTKGSSGFGVPELFSKAPKRSSGKQRCWPGSRLAVTRPSWSRRNQSTCHGGGGRRCSTRSQAAAVSRDNHRSSPTRAVASDDRLHHEDHPRTAPVKCPPPRGRPQHSHPSNYGSPADLENLERIYDLHTWNMYLLITEARRQQQKHGAGPGEIAAAVVVDDSMEPLHHGRSIRANARDCFDNGDRWSLDQNHHHHLTQPADAIWPDSCPGSPGYSGHEMIFGDLD